MIILKIIKLLKQNLSLYKLIFRHLGDVARYDLPVLTFSQHLLRWPFFSDFSVIKILKALNFFPLASFWVNFLFGMR